MRDAAVDPDVDSVSAFPYVQWKSKLFCESGIIQFEPNVRAALSNEISELANNFWIENNLTILAIKNWQRHTPAALPRNHPVGSRFNGARDAVLAPCRDPFHFIVDGLKRSATQLINSDEELIDVAKDDRRFRSPAIWIGVMKFFFAQQHPALAKQFHNVGIRVEHVFARQIR